MTAVSGPLLTASPHAAAVVDDAWLSGVIGSPVFRVVLPDPSMTAGVLAAVREHRTTRAAGLYWAKIDTRQVAAATAFTRAGFSVVTVDLVLAAAATIAAPTTAGIAVRLARPGDRETLLDIAGSAFRWNRFHLDPLIPRVVADRVKREWLASHLDGARGDEVLVAVGGDQVLGFLAAASARLAGRPARAIDLVAVRPGAEGRGIGRSLTAAFLEGSRGRAEHVMVGTQAANHAAMRLYEGLGFRLVGSTYALHLHVDQGRPREDD
jgi:ribosomal protein S18 acetylase RimI-like enzyme